ncbi:MAG: hypothetical protein JXR64_07870 [Spirochaetales bacterium]|nr:hypothetical protein [Spirochaetales bacterium]
MIFELKNLLILIYLLISLYTITSQEVFFDIGNRYNYLLNGNLGSSDIFANLNATYLGVSYLKNSFKANFFLLNQIDFIDNDSINIDSKTLVPSLFIGTEDNYLSLDLKQNSNVECNLSIPINRNLNVGFYLNNYYFPEYIFNLPLDRTLNIENHFSEMSLFFNIKYLFGNVKIYFNNKTISSDKDEINNRISLVYVLKDSISINVKSLFNFQNLDILLEGEYSTYSLDSNNFYLYHNKVWFGGVRIPDEITYLNLYNSYRFLNFETFINFTYLNIPSSIVKGITKPFKYGDLAYIQYDLNIPDVIFYYLNINSLINLNNFSIGIGYRRVYIDLNRLDYSVSNMIWTGFTPTMISTSQSILDIKYNNINLVDLNIKYEKQLLNYLSLSLGLEQLIPFFDAKDNNNLSVDINKNNDLITGGTSISFNIKYRL